MIRLLMESKKEKSEIIDTCDFILFPQQKHIKIYNT